MSEVVNPSINRPAEAFITAGAIAYGGGNSEGWIARGSSPTELAVDSDAITEANLNTFAQTSSGTSFDVTIDPGEAFIFGAWTAIDTSTTVTLASSTNNQTVYLGWNTDNSNDVIIGLDAAFDTAAPDIDERIPLYDFDTDGSGVTAVTDRRTIGKTLDGRFVNNTASVSTNYTTSGEQLIFADSSGGALTVTLSTEDLDNGSNVIVVDSGGSAKSNNITIDTEGSASINGNTSTTIESNYGAKAVASDGSNWFTSGAGGGGGAFADADGDTIAELGDAFSGIQVDDDEEVQLSTNASVYVRYNSTQDDIQVGGNQKSAGVVQSKFASPSWTPKGVGLDSSDCIWNADGVDSIYQLNQSGTVQSKFASPSNEPRGLGIGSANSIWHADGNTDSIYEINHSGTVQGGFLAPSVQPRGVGLDSGDCIWNADYRANSIYEINQSGTVQSQFASPSSGPKGVGLDSSDCIWHADLNTVSIYEINQSGTVQSQFASPSSGPEGVGLDSSDCIWHADASADSIYELNGLGSPKSPVLQVDRSTGNLSTEGSVSVPSDENVELSSDGSVHLRYDSGQDDVRIGGDSSTGTTTAGKVQSKFASPSISPIGVGVGSNDSVWNSDTSAGSIYKLDNSGVIQSRIASPSAATEGIDLDSNSCIWNADSSFGNGSIYQLNQSGTIQNQFSTPSSNPTGLGVDSNDSLWNGGKAADSIYELNQTGAVQSGFVSPSSDPQGVGIDTNDCIWHADRNADLIYEINQSGTIQNQFATPSSSPRGIGIDSGGCIWHADDSADSIYELTRFSTTDTTDLMALDRSTGDLTIEGTLTEGKTL